MYFLLNDAVLSLDLQSLTPPLVARQFSALTIDAVKRLGCEMFAEDPRLQHHAVERARRLATLIVSKVPSVNAALFVAPARNCHPSKVAVRLASIDVQIVAQLQADQQLGRLTPAMADQVVWGRLAA